jgi:23S rRNA pseudouridine2605 synthase
VAYSTNDSAWKRGSSLTAEQLEAARAERMRQNGHGAITIEDVRTWIEETGLCIFLPRSAQAGQAISPAPTFIEAVAGQRTTEPTPELITTAESLLVRLEAEGVAVRLNLAGQLGSQTLDQPDYVVAGWVLPYIYALRGDRDWRRSPQLTGSRQVSQLAVQAAKQIDSANMTATEIRDALGREVTEAAVLRALYELWKQLRIIPVVPAVGVPALWQPLRQRFQKAIAEGASTSQVTAISVLASIYLQAVIAASMEDVEMFLSPLTSRSKIREVVRGLAATRQVHTTTMGHSPMFYVAGTLPEFPAAPSFQISASLPAYRNGNYRGSGYLSPYLDQPHEEEPADTVPAAFTASSLDLAAEASEVPAAPAAHKTHAPQPAAQIRHKPVAQPAANSAAGKARSGKASPPRPRTARSASGAGDRRRAPAPRGTASNGNGGRSATASRGNGAAQGTSSHGAGHGNGNGTSNGVGSHSRNGSFSNGNGNHSSGSNGVHTAKPYGNGNGVKKVASSRPTAKSGSAAKAGPGGNGRNGTRSDTRAAAHNGSNGSHSSSRPGTGPVTKVGTNGVSSSGLRSRSSAKSTERKPAAASATKRYSFSGQAKQAPKAASKPVAREASKNNSSSKSRISSKSRTSSQSRASSKSHSGPARPAEAKRRA